MSELLAVEVEGEPWPRCPDCHASRSVSCPSCDSIDCTWEDAAGMAPGRIPDDPTQRQVICPICDEVFRMELMPACQTCGRRFANDRVLESNEGGESEGESRGRRSSRSTMKTVLLIVVAVVVFYTLYDWIVSTGGGSRLF